MASTISEIEPEWQDNVESERRMVLNRCNAVKLVMGQFREKQTGEDAPQYSNGPVVHDSRT